MIAGGIAEFLILFRAYISRLEPSRIPSKLTRFSARYVSIADTDDIATVDGGDVSGRQAHVLMAENQRGPYKPCTNLPAAYPPCHP